MGEWQEGKRIKWFDEQEVDRLKAKGLLTNNDLTLHKSPQI